MMVNDWSLVKVYMFPVALKHMIKMRNVFKQVDRYPLLKEIRDVASITPPNGHRYLEMQAKYRNVFLKTE